MRGWEWSVDEEPWQNAKVVGEVVDEHRGVVGSDDAEARQPRVVRLVGDRVEEIQRLPPVLMRSEVGRV